VILKKQNILPQRSQRTPRKGGSMIFSVVSAHSAEKNPLQSQIGPITRS